METMDIVDDKYAEGGSMASGGELKEYYEKMENHLGKKGAFIRILKYSQFGHYKGTPENEYRHNRGRHIAVIGKDNMGANVHLSNYTENTKRFLGSTIFDNPQKLNEYLQKNQIYAKGGSVKKSGYFTGALSFLN